MAQHSSPLQCGLLIAGLPIAGLLYLCQNVAIKLRTRIMTLPPRNGPLASQSVLWFQLKVIHPT